MIRVNSFPIVLKLTTVEPNYFEANIWPAKKKVMRMEFDKDPKCSVTVFTPEE